MTINAPDTVKCGDGHFPSIVPFAKGLISACHVRDEILFDAKIADIEWFILLSIFVVQEPGGILSLSDIYNASKAPRTTVLSTIKRLVNAGHLRRHVDPNDGRRNFVHLTPDTHERLCLALFRIRESLVL